MAVGKDATYNNCYPERFETKNILLINDPFERIQWIVYGGALFDDHFQRIMIEKCM